MICLSFTKNKYLTYDKLFWQTENERERERERELCVGGGVRAWVNNKQIRRRAWGGRGGGGKKGRKVGAVGSGYESFLTRILTTLFFE